MATMKTHANRTLRPRTLSDGTRRGIERYFSFEHGQRPLWWDEVQPLVTGDIVGVYENCSGEARDAIVISDEGVTVLRGEGADYFPFDQVKRLLLPEKDPVSRSLQVHLHSGASVEIPVYEPVGAAFDFYRLLISAVAERQRPKSS